MNLTKTLLATCLLAATTLPLTAMAVEEEATPEQAAATTGGYYQVLVIGELAGVMAMNYARNNPGKVAVGIYSAQSAARDVAQDYKAIQNYYYNSGYNAARW